jgi:hypothetical protein
MRRLVMDYIATFHVMVVDNDNDKIDRVVSQPEVAS